MTLTSGTRLGPSEIGALVGAGGMGEVYRARDTRLDRTVAVKVLTPRAGGDSDLRTRFEREARAVSSLNHPHICALFDVGHSDGIDYLVLEFLEGETLDARLAKGPLPVDQALRFALEICDALERAHRQGLTHRDLKPANVMLTRSGTKLLDFGLAKPRVAAIAPSGSGAESGSASSPPSSMATRVTTPLTREGTIVGTVQYMAPEQIEGREADARTDIWAFGCLLYEMLSGRPAFPASTPASLIAAILERQPAPLGDLTGSPQRLWDIIRVCLEKDPDDRWQSARDLRRELQWCVDGARMPHAAETSGRAQPPSRRGLLAAFVAVVAVVGASGLWWSSRASTPAVASGPPVIVLMDSAHPERVYDEATRKAGGTNADDLTDLLRDLPVVLLKENTNMTWNREYKVLQQNPALIVAHRSCFYDATILGEASRQTPFVNLSWDKFETFAGFVAQANPRTRVLTYSRGSWQSEQDRVRWVVGMERRFPPLKGRIDAMRVPLDRATFRHPTTGSEMREHIVSMLHLGGPATK